MLVMSSRGQLNILVKVLFIHWSAPRNRNINMDHGPRGKGKQQVDPVSSERPQRRYNDTEFFILLSAVSM